MVNLKQIKKNTLLKIIITILIIFLIWFNFIVSNERNIEIDAGHYLIKNGIKDSVKLINAERVGYYGGLLSEQIMIAPIQAYTILNGLCSLEILRIKIKFYDQIR